MVTAKRLAVAAAAVLLVVLTAGPASATVVDPTPRASVTGDDTQLVTADLTTAVEPVSAAPTMPATLPSTGGGGDAPNVVIAARAAGAVGLLLVVATRRRTIKSH